MNRIALAAVTVAFAVLTVVALVEDGLTGIFLRLLGTAGGLQVFVDLVIALTLFLFWMWKDAKKTGRNPWVWLVLTLTTGSFGPLFYLLLRKKGAEQTV